MAGLGVNIDHVATVRQARETVEPDPVWAAAEAQLGGADCITFHLRKDRRHICDRDARLLKQTVTCKLNMEMSLDPEIVEIAVALAPQQATLVPENRQEITTEGGLDVIAQADRVSEVTAALHDAGVTVSAFIDPVSEQILAARHAGCEAIEIHTGTYANAWLGTSGANPDPAAIATALAEIQTGLQAGIEAGLIVHAGHGLTYTNIGPVAEMQGFCEFNIGHSIIARAVFTGLRRAVAKMKRLIA
ncbi:MAG: pyridoxine 5'-phosphate synthase [Phycisphaerae bacterium]|jgi:pyridoxine 5-phosphate synthase|nr:pyridoxine 5'-phosphate synthase [Phycisphaerae bacterium]